MKKSFILFALASTILLSKCTSKKATETASTDSVSTIPAEALTPTSLEDASSKVVDFKEITSKNKITYVDFWASWCAPCRAEMPDSKKLRDEYASKGVNFVYISTDENAADWDKANKKIGLPDDLSFLLPNSVESKLVKQFKVNAIPRYMLINKNGKVIDADALRPSDKEIRGVLNELLK